MDSGHFYFLNDQYYIDFPDPLLMKNKEVVNGIVHDRPCFYSFQDKTTKIYWLIPLSSRIAKFKSIHNQKVQKYGFCNTILFGNVLGHEKAFLIQNMCPVTKRYIKNEYIDYVSSSPVRIDGVFEQQLLQAAAKVLALQRKGNKLIFPDVLSIEQKLLADNTNNS